MKNDGTPLPATLSGTSIERLVRIDEALVYLVNGALEYLCDREKFEQTGTLTVEDAKTALSDMFEIYFNEEVTVIPVGATMTWHTATPPSKWLICNGQSVLKTAYPELYAVWGNKYGSTSTNFTILDMRDRSPLGVGTWFSAVDSVAGAFNVTLGVNEMPAHVHQQTVNINTPAVQFTAGTGIVDTPQGIASSNTNALNTQSTGNGQPHLNLHPVKGVNWIVYAGK